MEKEIAFHTELVNSLTAIVPSFYGYEKENQVKLDAEQVVSSMRAKLDAFAVAGSSNGHHIREKLWKKHLFSQQAYPNISILYLDCILDSSFSKLVCSSGQFPYSNQSMTTADGKFYQVKLIELIAKRSPLLQSLSLAIPSYCTSALNATDLYISFGKSFQGLKNLTELNLSWNPYYTGMATFLAHLGDSCHQLKHLKLSESVHFGRKERLALVLGQSAKLLQQYITEKTKHGKCEDNILCSIQFADENVTPLCRSLESLTLLGKAQREYGRYVEDDEVGECYCIVNIPSMVFLLRHMPQLQKLDLHRYDFHGCDSCYSTSNCCLALNLLLKVSQSNNPVRVSEISWRDGDGHSSGDSISFQWTTNSPPRTPLNLSELTGNKTGCVNLASKKEMEAVVSFCPGLKTVHFVQYPIWDNDKLSTLDLNAILLNNLRQVVKVILGKIPADCRNVVLSILGSQLKRLELNNCESFQLDELMPCVGLKELVLRYDLPRFQSCGVTVDKLLRFIPQLKSLKKIVFSDGVWLEEAKTRLVVELEKMQIILAFEPPFKDVTDPKPPNPLDAIMDEMYR